MKVSSPRLHTSEGGLYTEAFDEKLIILSPAVHHNKLNHDLFTASFYRKSFIIFDLNKFFLIQLNNSIFNQVAPGLCFALVRLRPDG